MMDRFAAMEVLVKVIDTGSFSAAARQLGVGQPAISKTIAQLETRIGVKLLLRSTRGLSPTEAGQRYYEHAQRALDAAHEADLAATGAAAGLTGRLRFAAPVTFARLHLMPRLPAFIAQHPALAIDAILDDRRVDLIEESIDVALRIGTLADSTATAQRVGAARRIVVGTPAFFARHGEPRRPADLARYPAATYLQTGGGSVWTFRNGNTDETETATLDDALRTTAAEGMREAVFADIALCVTTEWMFRDELASGRVVEVLADWHLPTLDLWAVFPGGRRIGAKARAFANFVADASLGTMAAG
ncbi:LysR family transcriptional regulator [Paraburkholderia caballeronis]|nr:LysR family transcriptional regulator [Paraburkholderia caballeronis]TDV14653.1 LysR family transcriptional regulator [Paraburkholderia caballeronis]TDV23724.1 LysR family transcriptional regulator [Paraburkholderia caballeronis]TDV34124.1 DNA-binding transcriptional LysR family regulator [Paraburkholderia caballeronis]